MKFYSVFLILLLIQFDSSAQHEAKKIQQIDADLANGKEFPQQQIGAITSLAFDPSGQFLISGGSDQTIIFWNLTTGSVNLMPLIKHLYPVTSLAVNRESNLLASGDSNGNIILWDMAYGEPIGEPLLGLVRTVTSLAFSNDGRQLISGYESGDLFVWDIDIQSWIKRACDIAGRSLNEAEWNEYLNGEKFAPHCPIK